MAPTVSGREEAHLACVSVAAAAAATVGWEVSGLSASVSDMDAAECVHLPLCVTRV